MTLGKKIRHFRNSLNITQEQLASLTKIHIVTIKNYETDVLIPSPKLLNRIAEALNVSPEELIYNTSAIPIQTLGDMYAFVITLFKSELISLSTEGNIIITIPSINGYKTVENQQIYINNYDFLRNINKWNKMWNSLNNSKSEYANLLNKKGNELTKAESKIVYKIEEQEIYLERYEMKLINKN